MTFNFYDTQRFSIFDSGHPYQPGSLAKSNENKIEIIFANERCSAIVNKRGDIYLSVNSSRDLMQLKFHFIKDTESRGWIYSFNNEARYVPEGTTLLDFALAGGIVYQVYLINKYLFSKNIQKRHSLNETSSLGILSQSSQTPQSEENGRPCVKHNLICDVVGSSIPIWVVPPLPWCWVTVDILSCCEEHDIGLWCGTISDFMYGGPAAYIEINGRLAGCIADAVFTQVKEKTPWTCGGIVTGSLFGAVWSIIDTVIAFIGGLIFSPKGGDKDLFPDDNRHAKSCLCEGKEPTIQCSGAGPYSKCVDLCKKFKKEETCYNCKIAKCIYEGGRLKSTEYDFGPTGDPKDCCPDTTTDCLRPCRTCNKCMWGCDENGKWTILWKNTKDGLPCCEEKRGVDRYGRPLPCEW